VAQFLFFLLFVISVLAGVFIYFSPAQKAVNSITLTNPTIDNSEYSPDETSTRKKDLAVEIKTSGGIVQILKRIDDLTQEQKQLDSTIEEEKQALKLTQQEIADLANQAEKSDQDLLKIKALGSQMQDEQKLLVADGQKLIAVNDELTKNRQWLADQSDLVNINNQSSMEALQQHNAVVNNQSSSFIDDVSQKNNDAQVRAQDSEQKSQQLIEDQKLRMQEAQADKKW